MTSIKKEILYQRQRSYIRRRNADPTVWTPNISIIKKKKEESGRPEEDPPYKPPNDSISYFDRITDIVSFFFL